MADNQSTATPSAAGTGVPAFNPLQKEASQSPATGYKSLSKVPSLGTSSPLPRKLPVLRNTVVDNVTFENAMRAAAEASGQSQTATPIPVAEVPAAVAAAGQPPAKTAPVTVPEGPAFDQAADQSTNTAPVQLNEIPSAVAAPPQAGIPSSQTSTDFPVIPESPRQSADNPKPPIPPKPPVPPIPAPYAGTIGSAAGEAQDAVPGDTDKPLESVSQTPPQNPSNKRFQFDAIENVGQPTGAKVNPSEAESASAVEEVPLNLVIDDPDLPPDEEGEATEILDNPNTYFEHENRWESADVDKLPKPGDIIDRYEIISEIGRGGFGAVYKVKNLILDREEALKLILPDAKSDVSDIDKRFKREINIVSRLEHPNIVRLYSSGTLDHNILWMSMELIRGELLGSVMDREGAIPFFRTKAIMLQILSGLQDAHALEIVHRDLKPNNIMISKRKGYDELVYILDFGLSKAIGNSEDAEVQNVTANLAHSIYGTPNYMAPEQFAASGELSPSVDIYAAGIIFLELLTGTHAFNGSVFEIAVQQQTAEVPIPDHLKNTAIEAVILKACQKNSLLRYQNAGEFYDALSRIQEITDTPDVLVKPAESIDHTLETQFIKQPDFNGSFIQMAVYRIDQIHADLIKLFPPLDRILFYACPVLAFFMLLFFILMILT